MNRQKVKGTLLATRKKQQKRLVLPKRAFLYSLVLHSRKILTKPPAHKWIILSRANPVKHDEVLLDTMSSNTRGLLSKRLQTHQYDYNY